ncbi:IS66 family transposase [bacterium AH-315-N03]|nr:IS66 family transposase [bacterium AH-315-N03]
MPDLEELLRRLDALAHEQAAMRERLTKVEGEREEARRERDHYRELYQQMLERNRLLERGLLGQKSERLEDGEQLSLGVLELVLGERAMAEIEDLDTEQVVKEHKRKKPTGRKPIPDHIPRVDVVIVPEEVEREGLDAFDKIGEDITEVLERRPASMVVARIIKPKFVRKGRKEKLGVVMGPTPGLPIPMGLAGPGLLADTLVRRWQDHLPLNRLEGIYAREGVELARSTICGWHEQLANLCERLVAAMRRDAFEQPYLCTDATGVLVQAKNKCRRGHFWVMVAPGRHVLFEYTRDHTGDAVDMVLAGYEGYLVADAHVVYDHLYEGGKITEVNCWAHARRYFFKSIESDPERAKAALGYIGALFRVERSIADAPRKKREHIRNKHSRPIVETFFSWCNAQWPHVLEDSPIHDGVRYARNQRKGLSRFLDDGRLPLDNNMSERQLRRQAVGRKNWMFLGSDDGGRVNAIFTSLLASCRMLGVEPWSYLRDIFCLLPDWPAHDVLDLAPVNWPRTRVRDDVQHVLGLDPYRLLTLGG